MNSSPLDKLRLPDEVRRFIETAPKVSFPADKAELVDLALGGERSGVFQVKYAVPGKGEVVEAEVVRCRNGVAVNYFDPYMRRRDPESMAIADESPTDKTRFEERFATGFSEFRKEVFDWLGGQELVVHPFYAGGVDLGFPAMLIGPANAAFFNAALADLQGLIAPDDVPDGFEPRAFVYLAPPFRHTHCGGRQIVVHNRQDDNHEVFSLNLYPGPSAKKGIYGVLLSLGEKEGWVTVHGSTVKVTTPYDNEFVILHEGASGGGKSEMLQYPHREPDGRLRLGKNTVTGERRYVSMLQGCALSPVTDDMALCHPKLQGDSPRLVVADAEKGWFVRVNHIDHYGVDRYLEELCINPPEPVVFLNLYAVPNATCLIWEHTEDSPGRPCPNPRVILPRKMIPDVINDPVEVDVRSFGVRTPPCTREHPTYGIIGLLHFLPPALAWLWRLVSPRGYANPSVTESEGMSSEGVGSYWPFATGRMVDQANLLLKQIIATPRTRYTISPNQHIGCWETGFMPQWIAREYLSRRGSAKFKPEHLAEARCPLLGYTLRSMQVEGVPITCWFLETNTQPEVGDEGYDAGAEILYGFFTRELKQFYDEPDLDPLGKKIIQCCFDKGSVEDYQKFMS
jgi:hypothetical protein